jgi:hypothetical protein
MNPALMMTQVGASLPRLVQVAILSLFSAMVVAAQEPDSAVQPNEINDAEVLTRLGELIQAAGSVQPEDMVPPPGSPPRDNGQPPSGDRGNRFSRSDDSSRSQGSNGIQSSSRSQTEDRRSRSRRSSKSKSDPSRGSSSTRDYSRGSDRADSASGTNAGPVALDYSAFKIILERNIFDPNRYPRQSRTPTRAPTRVDSLTLVGTMSYDKGEFAFFDGTSSDYKKALKLRDVIAGYKVTNITPTSVALASGTNELKLGVGMQLRREEDGPWQLSGQSQSYAATPASTSTSTNAVAATGAAPTSSAAESDIVKKLMQRRQQE